VKSLRIWKCEFWQSLLPLLQMAKQSTIVRSRVAELEQENARLQTLAQKSASHDGNSRELISEVEQLRARLAAAEQRERELSSQLSKRPMAVKAELSEPRLPTSPVRHSAFPAQLKSSDKTSASLSLLVSLTAHRSEAVSYCVLFRSFFVRFPPYFRCRRLPSPRYPWLVPYPFQMQHSTSTPQWLPRWTFAPLSHAIVIGVLLVPWTLTWTIACPAFLHESLSLSTPMLLALAALISVSMRNPQPMARSVCAYTAPPLRALPLSQVRIRSPPHLPRSILMTSLHGASLLHRCRQLPQSLCCLLPSLTILSLALDCQTKSSGSTSILRCCSTAPPYSLR